MFLIIFQAAMPASWVRIKRIAHTPRETFISSSKRVSAFIFFPCTENLNCPAFHSSGEGADTGRYWERNTAFIFNFTQNLTQIIDFLFLFPLSDIATLRKQHWSSYSSLFCVHFGLISHRHMHLNAGEKVKALSKHA